MARIFALSLKSQRAASLRPTRSPYFNPFLYAHRQTWFLAATLAALAPELARAQSRRFAARPDLPAPVDLDSDQLVWRPDHHAGPAADSRGTAARHAHANGHAHGDGNFALCAVLFAIGRVAGPGAQAAGLCVGRNPAGRVPGQYSGVLGAGCTDHPFDVRGRLCDWLRVCDSRHRRANCADPGGGPRTAGRSPRQKRAGVFRRRSRRAWRGRCFDQAGRRAAGPGGRCLAADGQRADFARPAHCRGRQAQG